MIGEWDPTEVQATAGPSADQLAKLALFSETPAKADDVLRKQAASWIKASVESWNSAFATMSDEQLIALAFFYVRAEQSLSGFESGAQNPAIHVFRYLKSQGRKPERDTVKALKAETDNRFIPHGDALS